MINKLSTLLKISNLHVSQEQKNQLIFYIELLFKWNKIYNLTSECSKEHILIYHILDSIIIKSYIQGKNFIDFGTGAGLPGIPLAIVCPQSYFTLLDSRKNRINFVHHAQYRLGIKNVTIQHSRVENFFPKILFDGIMSRAVGSVNHILNLCHHLIAPTGKFYFFKSCIANNVISIASSEFIIENIIPLIVPELNKPRYLLIIKRK